METSKQIVEVRVADLEIHDPAFFRDLLKAVYATTEEPILTLDPEGIRIKNMDPGHAYMIDLFIPRDYFGTYNVVEERKISFNLKDLLKLVFPRGKMKDTTILMRIEVERIVFEIKRGGSRVRKTLPLIEPYEGEIPEVDLTYKARVKTLTSTMIRTLKDCSAIESDRVLITVDLEEITFRNNEGDSLEVTNIYDKAADEILDFNTDGKQEAYYNIEYLKTIIKALKPITEALTLELSTDIPMRITAEFPIIDGHLIYYLAAIVGYHEDPEEVEETAAAVDPVKVDPHEDPEEIPGSPGIDIYQGLENLGFYAYSGADGDLYRKNGLTGWRIQVYWGALVRIQQKGVSRAFPDKWVTIRDYGIKNPDNSLIPEHDKALEAIKELMEKGTLEEIPATVDDALNDNDIDLDQNPECIGDYDPSNPNCTVHCDKVGPCETETARVKAILEDIREQNAEAPEVEATVDPHKDTPSLGDLYLQYYNEARARLAAEDA